VHNAEAGYSLQEVDVNKKHCVSGGESVDGGCDTKKCVSGGQYVKPNSG